MSTSKNTMLLIFLVLASAAMHKAAAQGGGSWELLVRNAGISAMHAAVTRYNTVVLLDRTNNGATQIMLDRGRCRNNSQDMAIKDDCYAHSVLLDLKANRVRPLMILTDTWCSSGQFLPDGTLLQSGGDFEGNKIFRTFTPCKPTELCDWVELNNVKLYQGRWYASNQILPDGSIIVIGGRDGPTLEFYPQRPGGSIFFPFLAQTGDDQGDNLYPYVHLLPNNFLFVFANTKSIIYDYQKNVVVKQLPTLDGGPRNYPSAGSSAMLALEGDYNTAEVVVCGGAEYGSFKNQNPGAATQKSCGRIVATADNPTWQMEDMPFSRIMGDMVMLPNGDVLIINGAQTGSQGFMLAKNPTLNPVLYQPKLQAGSRFTTLNPTTVPRVYHSTANLLPDGRILLAGSNTHYGYVYDGDFPTELRIEAFSPPYLASENAGMKPIIIKRPKTVPYGKRFNVVVTVTGNVEVNIASAPFSTHSYAQGQRLVKLKVIRVVALGGGQYRVVCTAPPNGAVAPPGYYMLFAVYQGVPSVASWIQLTP